MICLAMVKADVLDAAKLAQLLRVQLIPEVHSIRVGRGEIRDLLPARIQLVSCRLQWQRSIGAKKETFLPRRRRPFRFHAGLQLAQQALLRSQIQCHDHMLRDRVLATTEALRLVCVPEIGRMIAYTSLLEIDDIAPLSFVRSLHSPCCLVPGSHNCGCKTHHKRSRDGSRYLKIAFRHASLRVTQDFCEAKADCPCSDREGTRDRRLRSAVGRRTHQRNVSWTSQGNHEALHVAPSG